MRYISTRGSGEKACSVEVLRRGIAPDGGLYVPDTWVGFSLDEIIRWGSVNYPERAEKILAPFFPEYGNGEVAEYVRKAYDPGKFDNAGIAPVRKLDGHTFVMELWHGPTSAFKDIALQLFPLFLAGAAEKTGEKGGVIVLVATSGDTGKAALEGFRDVDGVRVAVFYPLNGVSEMQKLQMATQEGRNVFAAAVEGNFDDIQKEVKQVFADREVLSAAAGRRIALSSANSINWGRLAPQIAYYFSAYADLVSRSEIKAGEKINFAVPTGNFGNILSAYYAAKMGLPVNRLICASNENNILTDFINTGVYDTRREFRKTISPSMDILVSSNLERLLFDMACGDSGRVGAWMKQLRESGVYTVEADIRKVISDMFRADFATEGETMAVIRKVYGDMGYLTDTHTAVGISVLEKYRAATGDYTTTVVAATASPFKFNRSVTEALFGRDAVKGRTEFELMELLSEKCGLEVPEGLRNLDKKPLKHTGVYGRGRIKEAVLHMVNAGC